MLQRFSMVVVCMFAAAVPAFAQPALPLVDDVDWRTLQQQTGRLCQTMKNLKMDLPVDLEREIDELSSARDKDQASKAIQKLLDERCLAGITINPESRVKVARGRAEPLLVKERDVFVLVKIRNEGGVTSSLAVGGPQIVSKSDPADGRWLEAAIHPVETKRPALTGGRLEYAILRLRARESGKREATIHFDVGQGTEDLGFRAEVPILFVVK